MQFRQRSLTRGFTFIELVLAAGIVVILGTIIVISLDPARYLGKSRNARRNADVVTIANAIGQNILDNRGVFSCVTGAIPTSATRISVGIGNYNIAPCLIPVYLEMLPYDPLESVAHYTSIADYDTAYAIAKNAVTGRVTISALYPELGETITATR